MPYVDPEFEVPTIPPDEIHAGTEIDRNVLDDKGEAQALGEYESARTLFAVTPDHVPRPRRGGPLGVQCAEAPAHHRVQAHGRRRTAAPPSAPALAAVVAALHQRSRSTQLRGARPCSPTGTLGFHVATSQSLPLDSTSSATRGEATLEREQAVQGHSAELQALAEHMTTNVVPRLLAADGVRRQGG